MKLNQANSSFILYAVGFFRSNFQDLLNLDCRCFVFLSKAELAVGLQNLSSKHVIHLSWSHHHRSVTIWTLAALSTLDAGSVIVEVRSQHLTVIVKCPPAALWTQSLSLGLLCSLPGQSLLLLPSLPLLSSLQSFCWTISFVYEDHLMASVTDIVSFILMQRSCCQIISEQLSYN